MRLVHSSKYSIIPANNRRTLKRASMRGEFPDAFLLSEGVQGCRGPSTQEGLHFVKSLLRSGSQLG